VDIINHIGYGYITAKLIERAFGFEGFDLPLELTCSASAVLPDIIGFAEKVIKNNYKLWSWYNWAHRLNVLWLMPPYLLHVLMDIPAHYKDRKYWWHCNILSWILLIIIWFIL